MKGMELADRSNKHVRFDPLFLKEEEERKKEKKVSFFSFGWKQRLQIGRVDAYVPSFLFSFDSQELAETEAANTKSSKLEFFPGLSR